MTPVLSPKLEAYVVVMTEIQTCKLKRGIYPAEYTRQVNREIDGIRTRMMAAARRAKTAENLKKMLEGNPDLADRWQFLKLQKRYLNAAKLHDKLYRKIAAVAGGAQS